MTKESPKQTKKIRLIKAENDQFKANGHTYTIQSHLSVERYMQYLMVGQKMTFGSTALQLFNTLREIHELLVSGNDILGSIHKSAELAYNQLDSVKNVVEGRYPEVFHICALFINREDEDETKYDYKFAVEKINDWREEGYAIASFFYLASKFVSGLSEAYQSLTGTPLTPRADASGKSVLLEEIPPMPAAPESGAGK